MPFAPEAACGGSRLPPEAMNDIPRTVLDGIRVVVGSLVGTRRGGSDRALVRGREKSCQKVALRPARGLSTLFLKMEQGQIRGRMIKSFPSLNDLLCGRLVVFITGAAVKVKALQDGVFRSRKITEYAFALFF